MQSNRLSIASSYLSEQVACGLIQCFFRNTYINCRLSFRFSFQVLLQLQCNPAGNIRGNSCGERALFRFAFLLVFSRNIHKTFSYNFTRFTWKAKRARCKWNVGWNFQRTERKNELLIFAIVFYGFYSGIICVRANVYCVSVWAWSRSHLMCERKGTHLEKKNSQKRS